MLFYFVYIWRTLPLFVASMVSWGVFSYGDGLYYYLINIVNTEHLSCNFFSKTT